MVPDRAAQASGTLHVYQDPLLSLGLLPCEMQLILVLPQGWFCGLNVVIFLAQAGTQQTTLNAGSHLGGEGPDPQTLHALGT